MNARALRHPLIALALALAAESASAQILGMDAASPRPAAATATAATASRAAQAPLLDGRADDEVWRGAQAIESFRQFDPVEDGEPRFRTEARVAYDDRYLYVLVRAHDPHPDSIVALLSRRDVRTPSDQIKIMIDSYHDRRTGYEFAVNPAGVKRDYYMYNDADEDESWDAVWDVATAIDSLGWVAEFKIPLSQLRFPKRDEHTFGFAVWRDIARYNERVSWPVYRRSRAGLVSQLGEVGGIRGIGTPTRLEVMPYTVTRNVTQVAARDANDVPTAYRHRQEISGGADVKYGLTSNLTLDATINPDFGQVEADPAVLNLSEFETFFQERRPFFLEGTGIFRFDVNCNDGLCNGLFYSRRIGRSPQLGDGESPLNSTILGASKVTGRLAGGLSLGVLDAVTQRETGAGGVTAEPQSNYLVARAQQDLRGGETGIGAMLTSVHRRLDDRTEPYLRRTAYTGGVDFRHRFLGKRYEVSGFLAASRVTGTDSAIALLQRCDWQGCVHNFQRPDDYHYDPTRTSLTGDAEQIALNKVSGLVRFSSSYTRYSRGFEINDVGFLGKADVQSQSNWVGLQFNTPKHFYRRAFVNLNNWQNWTTSGMRTNLAFNVNAHAELKNSWWLHIGGTHGQLKSFGDTYARGGPAVRRSPYINPWAGIETDMRKRLAGGLFGFYWRGDYGRSTSWGLDPWVNLRLASNFSVELSPSIGRTIDDSQWYDLIPVDFGGDTAYTYARMHQKRLSLRARLDYTMTPTLSLQVYAEPFTTSGDFSDWRELADPRADDYGRRFVPFVRTYEGTRAASPPDPGGFRFSQFRSNTVLRWEYRPGSTLFAVWQQGRQHFGDFPGRFDFRGDYGDLFRQHPDNTFLVKASYWFSL